MFRFFETLCLWEGEVRYLEYHSQRIQRTLGGKESFRGLELHLQAMNLPKTGWWKIKLLYDGCGFGEAILTPYEPRMIQSFRLVRSDIDYSSKFTDRSALEALLAQRGEADEVIILKGEEITDTSFSNLALWNGEVWLTPQNPLLAGTARARLIDEGGIKEARLGERELREARALALLNAMMGMRILEKFEIL